MDIHATLIIGHIIGTILGVGGATFIEVHLNMALRDGKMDEYDRAILGKDFLLTRIGMAIGLITGIGFVIEYIVNNQFFRLIDGIFWAKMLIFLIIVINAYLLHKHKIGLYWGSAFSFVSWWTVMIFGTFLTNGIKFMSAEPLISFIVLMGAYGICVTIGAYILHRIRTRNTIPPVQ